MMITLLSCSPVRNRYMNRSNSNEKITKELNGSNNNSNSKDAQVGLTGENKDTIHIKLPPLYLEEGIENKSRSMNVELDSAIYDFNNGKIDKACEKFSLLQETLKENDSLYNETIFYSSECLIAHNEYKLANRLLNQLMNENLNGNLKQRVLLRQGHLLCALGDESTAQWYFDKLESEFPNSIYIKLANCNSLK